MPKMFEIKEEKGWIASLLLVLVTVGVIYMTRLIAPPPLMDDVDAVQAQIARNILTSGDWVTARLDGVLYLEKSPSFIGLWPLPTRYLACTIGPRAYPLPCPASDSRG